MALNNRQEELVKFLNQLSQSIANSGVSHDFSLNLPGINADFGLGLGESGTGEGTTPTPPDNEGPETMQDLLKDSINDTVQLTTPFGVVTGTLLDVKNDYVVLIESNGDQTLVRADKIEFVGEM